MTDRPSVGLEQPGRGPLPKETRPEAAEIPGEGGGETKRLRRETPPLYPPLARVTTGLPVHNTLVAPHNNDARVIEN